MLILRELKFDLKYALKEYGLLEFKRFLNEFLYFRVLMKGITWARDSHGLFDYESRHLSKSTMKTN